MQTLEVSIALDDAWHELLIAELTDLGFEGFVQEPGTLKAYLPAAQWNLVNRGSVEQWLVDRHLPVQVTERVFASQNWNAQWEASIEPLPVGRFLIKPTWADIPPEYDHLQVLHIDPKMSFGTGHHETTRLMLRLMERWTHPGARVLDAGTGTGILAVAALHLGAASALAFDIDPWAEENALENFARNQVADRAEFRIGSFEVIPETDFDLILANIQRHVILPMLPTFAEKLVPGGTVLISGILARDRDRVVEAALQHGFMLADEATEGEWWAGALSV